MRQNARIRRLVNAFKRPKKLSSSFGLLSLLSSLSAVSLDRSREGIKSNPESQPTTRALSSEQSDSRSTESKTSLRRNLPCSPIPRSMPAFTSQVHHRCIRLRQDEDLHCIANFGSPSVQFTSSTFPSFDLPTLLFAVSQPSRHGLGSIFHRRGSTFHLSGTQRQYIEKQRRRFRFPHNSTRYIKQESRGRSRKFSDRDRIAGRLQLELAKPPFEELRQNNRLLILISLSPSFLSLSLLCPLFTQFDDSTLISSPITKLNTPLQNFAPLPSFLLPIQQTCAETFKRSSSLLLTTSKS